MDINVSSAPAAPSSLPGFGSLFSEAWKLFKDRFWRIIFLDIVIMIAILIAGAVSYASVSAFGLVGLVITALLVIATLYFGLSVRYAAVRIILKNSTIQESISIGFKKAWSYLWVGILLGVVTLGGFIMGIIPGFIFAVWLMFSYFVLVDEDKRGMDALLRSREYIKGRSWEVFWKMILLFLVTLGALLVAFVPIGMVSVLSKPLGLLINYAIQIAISIFSLAFMSVVYGHLVATRPELRSAPVSEKRKLFTVSAILGAISPFLIIALLYAFLYMLTKNGFRYIG